MEAENNVPRHVAIIMDGNRRWAREKGLNSLEGHKKGAENLIKIAKYGFKKGIRIATFYAFSQENWQRSPREVNYLMDLIKKVISERLEELNQANIRLRISGELEGLPKAVQIVIEKALETTWNNTGGIVNIALNYGGRQELVRAFKRIIEKDVLVKDLTAGLINENLYTSGLPDPDIIIRTGGEKRLSNFLPWQGVYSELFFSDILWPDFGEKDLDQVLEDYQNRDRRFGK